MDTNGNNHSSCMHGTIALAIYHWHDTKICSRYNRYFIDCHCVPATHYQQKYNISGVLTTNSFGCIHYVWIGSICFQEESARTILIPSAGRRQRKKAVVRQTLSTLIYCYDGFDKIKAAVPYALNKGVMPIR